jgi:hypothetical protein
MVWYKMVYAYLIPDRTEPTGSRVTTQSVYTEAPDEKTAIRRFHNKYDYMHMDDMSLVCIQPLENKNELRNAEVL